MAFSNLNKLRFQRVINFMGTFFKHPKCCLIFERHLMSLQVHFDYWFSWQILKDKRKKNTACLLWSTNANGRIQVLTIETPNLYSYQPGTEGKSQFQQKGKFHNPPGWREEDPGRTLADCPVMFNKGSTIHNMNLNVINVKL